MQYICNMILKDQDYSLGGICRRRYSLDLLVKYANCAKQSQRSWQLSSTQWVRISSRYSDIRCLCFE